MQFFSSWSVITEQSAFGAEDITDSWKVLKPAKDVVLT